MHHAVDELAVRATFRGYGPEQGYEFLRTAIATNDYRAHGMDIADDEIFVSDGSKCDCGAILDILGHRNQLAITDPVYPQQQQGCILRHTFRDKTIINNVELGP